MILQIIEMSKPGINNLTEKILFLVILIASIFGSSLICLLSTLTSTETYFFNSAITLCSSYLVLKYQSEEIHLYILAIVSSVLCFIFILACLILFIMKRDEKGEKCLKFKLSQQNRVFVYCSLSLAILWNIVLLGRFADLIIDGKSCLYSSFSSQIIILSISLLIFLLLACGWVANIVMYYQKTQNPTEIEDEEISFGGDSPYFNTTTQKHQEIIKPFLNSGKSIEKSEGQFKKKTQIEKLDNSRQGEREEVSFERSFSKKFKFESLSESSQRQSQKDNFSKRKKNEKNDERKKVKTIYVDSPKKKDSFNSYYNGGKQVNSEIKNMETVKLNLEKRNNNSSKSNNDSEIKQINKNVDNYSDHKSLNQQFRKTKQVEKKDIQSGKGYHKKIKSEYSLKNDPNQAQDWMFFQQNPYGKYIREDEIKQEQLQMIIFSQQSSKIRKEKGLVFSKRADPSARRKSLFQQPVLEDVCPSSPRRKRSSSLYRLEQQVLSTLRNKAV